MEVYQLKCPNCGAILEIEEDLDYFFCKYCGTRIIADETIRAHTEIRKEQEITKRQAMYLEHDRYLQRENTIQLVTQHLPFIIGCLLTIIIFGFLFFS